MKCSSGTSVPPHSNDNCAANKNTESLTAHKRATWLRRGLFHISIQSSNFIAHPRGEERPAGLPPWGNTQFCHLLSKKNLDASPATDPAANK